MDNDKILRDLLNYDDLIKNEIEEQFKNNETISNQAIYPFIRDDNMFEYFLYHYPREVKDVLQQGEQVFYDNKFDGFSISRNIRIPLDEVQTFQWLLHKRRDQLKEQFKKDGYDLGEW